MNLTIIKNTATAIIVAAIIIPLSSCIKDKFTVPSPGANINPAGVQATMTIAQFKQLYYVPILGQTLPVAIPDSIVLTGIINADDRSGNFYKTLSLQDSTGGIQLKIAGTNLYQTYPEGRRIWIKTKGLYIFDYGGTAQIGGYVDLSTTHPSVGGIALTDAQNVIITGEWGLTVPVQKISIYNLNFGNYVTLQSMLYEIDSVEYAAADTLQGVTYADQLTKGSGSVTLEDCSGNSMVVYSSGYANFASAKPNSGHGNILGIYTYYSYASSNNAEFVIRDTTDVRFTASQRCQ
jgi:hypothetical protein